MTERLTLLISGSGTTMVEMIKAIQTKPTLKGRIEVTAVISDNPRAAGLNKAREMGIHDENILIIDPNQFRDEDGLIDMEGFGQAMLTETRNRGTTLITQNGYLSKTSPILIDAYQKAIFNQHPGPKNETRAMKGLQPHAVMLNISQCTGRNEGTEVTVHRVNENWDDGLTVGIEHVIIDNIWEDPKVIQAKALPLEHQLQIALLEQFVTGNVKELKATPLYIRPGEEAILDAARRYAKQTYPDG